MEVRERINGDHGIDPAPFRRHASKINTKLLVRRVVKRSIPKKRKWPESRVAHRRRQGLRKDALDGTEEKGSGVPPQCVGRRG